MSFLETIGGTVPTVWCAWSRCHEDGPRTSPTSSFNPPIITEPSVLVAEFNIGTWKPMPPDCGFTRARHRPAECGFFQRDPSGP